MRIVFDTNSLIRAHRRIPSRARSLLEATLDGGHRLLVSNQLLAEVSKVLRYPRIHELYGISEPEIFEYIQFLQSVSTIVLFDPTYLAPLRDPADLAVLQVAEHGEADILCTQDADFFDQAVIAYCATLGLEICTEMTLAKRLLRAGTMKT